MRFASKEAQTEEGWTSGGSAGTGRGKGHVARVITTGLLAASMGFGAFTPTIALAVREDPIPVVTYGAGTIRINNANGNETSFLGWQIFRANVHRTSGTNPVSTATDISWANDTVREAVEGFIKSVDSDYAGTSAEEAAQWMEANVAGFTTGTDAMGNRITESTDQTTKNRTWVDHDTVADKLAKAVKDLPSNASVPAGEQTALGEGSEGWWVFLTADSALGTEEHRAATAPIYALIPEGDVAVNEKTKLPTVVKEVKSDGKSDFEKGADAQIGEKVVYRVTGTVSGNINEFESYKYHFEDTLSAGLTPQTEGVRVKLYKDGTIAEADQNGTDTSKGTDVTSFFTVSLAEGNKLSIDCEDLKKAGELTSNSRVVVWYQATLNENAVAGGSGNKNSVELIYSNNPHGEGTGKTTSNSASEYTYCLKLQKVDRNSEVKLEGAKFTVKVADSDNDSLEGKYVQENGTLGDKPFEFVTNSEGMLEVKGLDAGKYEVSETHSPAGYNPIPNFTFLIDSVIGGEDGMTLTRLDNVVTGRLGTVIPGLVTDGKTGDNVLITGSNAARTDIAQGAVFVTVGDAKVSDLPLTGEQGIGIAVAMGSAGVLISVAGAMMRRRTTEAGA